MSDHAADRGKSLQMLGARVWRGQQQEDEVDPLSVDGLVVDRLGQARKQAVDRLLSRDLAVGNGDAVTESGRSEAFPLDQARQDLVGIETRALPGKLRKLLQQPALVRGRNGRLDRIEIQ